MMVRNGNFLLCLSPRKVSAISQSPKQSLQTTQHREAGRQTKMKAQMKMPNGTEELKLLKKWLARTCHTFFLLSYLSSYPLEAVAGCPVSSTPLIFYPLFLFFFFFSLLLFSALRDIPSKKSLACWRKRHRRAPCYLLLLDSSSFQLSTRAFFFPGSGDT